MIRTAHKPVAARRREMGACPKPWCNTFLQIPDRLQTTYHPKNRKHKQTNPPEIHIPRQHEAEIPSDDAVVRSET